MKKPLSNVSGSTTQAKYPRHTVAEATRIPRAVLEQNAGQECSDQEAVGFLNLKLSGEMKTEIGSALKYGYFERPQTGRLRVTDLLKRIVRPQQSDDDIQGYRDAILRAPEFSDVYQHYRGENLPDEPFFSNALTDMFKIPKDKVAEFRETFLKSLQIAKLLEKHGDKSRVLDISQGPERRDETEATFKKLEQSVDVKASDTCFVMMPFASPIGGYFSQIYEPAIKKAGLRPVRADDDIFATGKIIDQVWRGINAAKVLVAELTSRNPNVFYELGIAHALKKPVVLISRSEDDVPFDVRHIRVIYYDVNDPYWGEKLLSKVAENILSALKNPEEAIFHNEKD